MSCNKCINKFRALHCVNPRHKESNCHCLNGSEEYPTCYGWYHSCLNNLSNDEQHLLINFCENLKISCKCSHLSGYCNLCDSIFDLHDKNKDDHFLKQFIEIENVLEYMIEKRVNFTYHAIRKRITIKDFQEGGRLHNKIITVDIPQEVINYLNQFYSFEKMFDKKTVLCYLRDLQDKKNYLDL